MVGYKVDDHLDNALLHFGLGEIDFQRIAVTEEQIEEFHLPPMPKSKETIDKVNHDTRKDRFIKKYGKLYIVELDALLAIVPDEFKSIVQESVDQFFDQGIYQAVLSDHQPDLLDSTRKELGSFRSRTIKGRDITEVLRSSTVCVRSHSARLGICLQW
ncbi:MAG: hypothetical protein WAM14_18885 [Candidatus Nitrosopolaris sp.]